LSEFRSNFNSTRRRTKKLAKSKLCRSRNSSEIGSPEGATRGVVEFQSNFANHFIQVRLSLSKHKRSSSNFLEFFSPFFSPHRSIETQQ
jgi:hypothetical protein